jgi:proline dehydrogenase
VRRILLWMARDRWLARHLPRLWITRRAVRRFMPGEDVADALAAGARFEEQGIVPLYTRLGEDLSHASEAEETADHYLEALDRIAASGSRGELSVKVTQLGFQLDPDVALGHLERLAARSRAMGRDLWIDMEGSALVDDTVALYERLKASHHNVGLCLQAYMHRTAHDIQRLLPLGPRIRLVKGAYDEPASIAYRDRPDVDANFATLAVTLLGAIADGRAARLGLGTHDVRLIELCAAHAGALGLPRSAFEVQMLYGIRSDEQRRLAGEGYVVRGLIAYGPAWYAWYMRRLAERPANVIFALRQALP